MTNDVAKEKIESKNEQSFGNRQIENSFWEIVRKSKTALNCNRTRRFKHETRTKVPNRFKFYLRYSLYHKGPTGPDT